MKTRHRSLLKDHLEAAAVAVAIALTLRFLVIAAYKIPTGSMIPTLKVGDFIFSLKLPYSLPFLNPRVPQRGEVIVFISPEDSKTSLIKRVVGVPGDRVELKKRELVINGVASKYEKLDPERVLNSPATEYYQVFEESIGDHRHLVMFRRDQEDDGFGPQVIPEGHVFVLGDNRDSSDDSRNWGLVPTSKIESQAMIIWLSLDWDRKYAFTGMPRIRWERILNTIR